MVEDVSILTQWDQLSDTYIDTITVYLGEKRQHEHYTYILSRQPRRLIFNPGAENDELVELATAAGIQTLEACTLVMLRTNLY